MDKINYTYSNAINEAFKYILKKDKKNFIIGQGLWSPWYVGSTMNKLEKYFGKSRVIDTPVSEAALTGLALGSSLHGMRPIVIHPRMDFAILALDQILNQANNWKLMFGGNSEINITIRAIINRGGSQGAQHSQDLHSLFSHFPNLKVLMPYSSKDAYDMLITACYTKDPVIYIDDRWLYSEEDKFTLDNNVKDISSYEPKVIHKGSDITIISSGYSTKVSKSVMQDLKKYNISSEIIDLRLINPMKFDKIINSIKKTKRYVVIDGGWSFCSLSDSIISNVERARKFKLKNRPMSFNIFDSAAPTSQYLEKDYYLNYKKISKSIQKIFS